jgi:hypothetical protein
MRLVIGAIVGEVIAEPDAGDRFLRRGMVSWSVSFGTRGPPD